MTTDQSPNAAVGNFILPDCITPLIRQHAADAAFYWQQIDNSEFSPVKQYEDIKTFHRFLSAHLDGLRAAEENGWNEALASFKRWKTQGEAFVCGLLAHESGETSRIDAVWQIMRQTPSTTLEGYLSALSYLPDNEVIAYFRPLLQSSDNFCVGVAITACGNAGVELTSAVLDSGLTHEDSFIKISTCKYLFMHRRSEYVGQLVPLIFDIEQELACHASIAATELTLDKSRLFPSLLKLIEALLHQPEKKGREALLHSHWLEKLVRISAHICLPRKDIMEVIATWPDYLKVIFFAHYGSTDTLPFLITALSSNELSRLAFWAISMIIGIDTDDATLLARTADNLEVPVTSRINLLSTGINFPDPEAVEAACQRYLSVQEILLMGQKRSSENCKKYLITGRQSARYTAFWILSHYNSEAIHLDNRQLDPVMVNPC